MKNIVELGRPRMTTWRMRVACWIPKVKNTISERVIHIAVPQKQWLHERATLLRYTYIAFLVCIKLLTMCVPGSIVGIATGYGLDGPGIEFRWGRDFPHRSRSALGSTQPPVQ